MDTAHSFSPALALEIEKLNFKLVSASEVEGFLDKADQVSLPSWPEFMLNDPVANQHWEALNDKHSDFQFALIDNSSNKWIAVGNSIPVYWPAALEELPDEGWDWALKSGMEDDSQTNMLCALAIQILPEARGKGLSTLMIKIMKEIGRLHDLNQLIAPVRPNKKCDYPLLPMETYIDWKQKGLRFDPWLRVHERLDARLIKVCHQAMKITGSVQKWQEWTGMSFQTSGNYVIPGALTPIKIDVENDRGDYVEPNVWMLHGEDKPT